MGLPAGRPGATCYLLAGGEDMKLTDILREGETLVSIIIKADTPQWVYDHLIDFLIKFAQDEHGLYVRTDDLGMREGL